MLINKAISQINIHAQQTTISWGRDIIKQAKKMVVNGQKINSNELRYNENRGQEKGC